MKTFRLEWAGHQLELGATTRIMGILNVTPDSFSDGGRFFGLDAALRQAERLVGEGADILDIGGESTRPFSDPVSVEEELRRVLPVIEYLAPKIPIPISIDTCKAAVAKAAISAGASIINDISALRFDPMMADTAAKHPVLAILMHMKGTPKNMQAEPVYDDPVKEIHGFLCDAVFRAEAAGIPKKRLIIDPGIGFGKTMMHNLYLIKHLDAFLDIGVPIMIGTSRKAFIRRLLKSEAGAELSPEDDRVITGTQATVACAVLKGAHLVRVHDVAAASATCRIADAIRAAVNA